MIRRRPTRRTIIVAIGSVVVLLLAGIYTWQSLSAWKHYESRLLNEQAEYSELKDAALKADSIEKRLAAVRKLDEKLEKRNELCKMNPLFAWQATVIPPLKAGVKECEYKVKKLGAVAAAVKGLSEYLDTVSKLEVALKKLAPGESFSEQNWKEKGLQVAKGVQAELKVVPGTTEGKQLQKAASDLSDRLVGAWESLIAANDAKDKTAFLAASAAVTKAYADFMTLADSSDSQLQEKVRLLLQTYEAD